MTLASDKRIEAARLVVDSGAVYTRSSGDPFFFSSGWASPIFIDIKRLISYPGIRDSLLSNAIAFIGDAVAGRPFDMIAGCELAGVPFAAAIADRLKLPLVVVRTQAKGFGRLAQIEGTFEPGARALLVDDLSTDGVNKANFRNALEHADASVVETFVFLDYRVFPASKPVQALMTLADVVVAAEEAGRLTGSDLNEVKSFVADAPRWSRRNGGIASL